MCSKCYSNSCSKAKGTNIFPKETTPEITLRKKKIIYDGCRELELTYVQHFTGIIPGQPDRKGVHRWITCKELEGRRYDDLVMCERCVGRGVGRTAHRESHCGGDHGGRWRAVTGTVEKRTAETVLVRWTGEGPQVRRVALHVPSCCSLLTPLSVQPACSSSGLATSAPKGWGLVH